jgi:hypothetical protein
MVVVSGGSRRLGRVMGGSGEADLVGCGEELFEAALLLHPCLDFREMEG